MYFPAILSRIHQLFSPLLSIHPILPSAIMSANGGYTLGKGYSASVRLDRLFHVLLKK